jgi:signal transduction histidine kinase
MATPSIDGDQMREASHLENPPGGFRLLRYFTLATLVAFAAVALALFFLQRMEEDFFEQVQHEQAKFMADAQALLARQHEEAARSSLLDVNEASHVNLTRLVANMLWQSDIAPFVAAAQRLSIDACRALPVDSAMVLAVAHPVTPPSPSPRRDCFARLGRDIMALPGFQALDAKAYAAMRASTVFKIKVFDLRGITVYSSERSQIGEDAFHNQGWRTAAAGRPASELTHRDKFSAFERVVENRDLISTYVPVRAAGREQVVGVFEIYADVTPFLGQIKAASKKFADITAANDARVAQAAAANRSQLYASSQRFLAIVGGLLVLLYATSLLIVRYGQRIIDAQSLAQARSARRERLWHREKMAALATMAANVSHEVGNPLAVISGAAEELVEANGGAALTGRRILEQTARIACMTRQIADFAAARSEAAELVDVNAMVKAVCGFLAFDRRFHATPIEFCPGAGLPACEVVPDHLNEALMELLQACVQAEPTGARCAKIRVETSASGAGVAVDVSAELAVPAPSARPAGRAGSSSAAALFAQPRLEPVRHLVEQMGGQLTLQPNAARIVLRAARDATAGS